MNIEFFTGENTYKMVPNKDSNPDAGMTLSSNKDLKKRIMGL